MRARLLRDMRFRNLRLGFAIALRAAALWPGGSGARSPHPLEHLEPSDRSHPRATLRSRSARTLHVESGPEQRTLTSTGERES